jgi:endonuclease VIII
MPEGDAVHRAARRLRVLVGERVEAESPHPRAAVKRIAERLDGRLFEGVEAVGKNLLLRFEGGVVLRSHLRMKGRWSVRRRGSRLVGRPWLVLRGSEHEAVQWNGPVLELRADVVTHLGPDILASPLDLDRMLANLRSVSQRLTLGESLLQQRLVAGIGNMWMAEALWVSQLSPWARLGEAADEQLRAALLTASRLMRESLDNGPRARQVYRRAGRPCRRCGTAIRSLGQGDANRRTYWCPDCQKDEPRPAM